MNKEKISGFHYYLVMITAIGLFNHVVVIPYVLKASYRDSWLSTILVLIPTMIWSGALYFINKRKGQDHLKDWLEQRLGKQITIAILILLSLYLFINAFLTQRELVSWTTTTFMPQTPPILVIIVFLLVCFYSTISGLKSIVILNGIVFPFIIAFGFLVGIGNLQHKDYSFLFPLLVYGPERVLHGMLYPAVGMSQMIIGILLTHQIKTKVTFRAIVIVGLILFLLILGPLTGVIAEFGPSEAERLRYPVYEEWSLLSFGRFIEHIDFLSIFQWFSGAEIRLSLFVYIIVEMFAFHNKKTRNVMTLLIFILILLIDLFPISDFVYTTFVYKSYFPYTFLLVAIMTLIFFVASFRTPKQDRKEGEQH